jgi:hypothetical protein
MPNTLKGPITKDRLFISNKWMGGFGANLSLNLFLPYVFSLSSWLKGGKRILLFLYCGLFVGSQHLHLLSIHVPIN